MEDQVKTAVEAMSGAFEEFKKAFHLRRVEIAMRAVPKTVKDIKERALTEVFAKELNQLDGESKEAFATASQGNKADSALQTVPVATSSTIGGFLYDWNPSTGVLNLRTS